MTESAHQRAMPALFGRALARLGQALTRTLPAAFAQVAGDLEAAADSTDEARDRLSLDSAAGRLRIEAEQRIARVSANLCAHAERLIDYADRPGAESKMLRLLIEDSSEQQILVDDLARAVRQTAAGDFVAFAEQLNGLWPGWARKDELNPVGARSLALASLQALALNDITAETYLQWRRSTLRRLPAALVAAIQDFNEWLSGHSVSEQPAAGMPASAGGGAPDQTYAAVGRPNRGAMVNAPMPNGLAQGPLAGLQAPVVPTLQPVVELERDPIGFAQSFGVLPYGREARARFFGNARARLQSASGSPAQLAVVDVVAAMFDYVIDDRRLPESLKPMLWRLQQPALALALMDPAYLGDEPRSLRRLIEGFGALGQAFVNEKGGSDALHQRLETVVRAVEVVAGALQTRSAVMARQIDHEYGRAAQSVAHLIERLGAERAELAVGQSAQNRRNYRQRPSPEREQEVTVRLSVMLGERLERHQVPASVREFLLTVWLRQLRTTALRDGEESGEFKVAMQVVDDLLWSLDAGPVPGGRRELAVRIPPLIRLLTQGSRASGVKDEALKPFFDELFLVHLRKMQGGGEADSAPMQIDPSAVSRLREPAAPAGKPESSGHSAGAQHPGGSPLRLRAADSAVSGRRSTDRSDISSRPVGGERVRAGDRRVRAQRSEPSFRSGGQVSADASAPDQRLLEVLSSIDLADLPPSPAIVPVGEADPMSRLSRGRWIEMVAHDGIHSFAKVAWINARRTVVLLVRHPDRRALSLRASEMVERFEQGRAFLIE